MDLCCFIVLETSKMHVHSLKCLRTVGPDGEKVSWHWQENPKSAVMISGVAVIKKQESKLICLVPIGSQLTLFCPKQKSVNTYFYWQLHRWRCRKSYLKSYTHCAGISQSIIACVRWVSLACPKLPSLKTPLCPCARLQSQHTSCKLCVLEIKRT